MLTVAVSRRDKPTMPSAAAALAAYAAADATALAGGSLQILDAGGVVLRTFALNTPAGTSAAAVFTLAGLPKVGTGSGAGTAATARYRTSADADYQTGFAVGVPGSGAPVIIDNGSASLAIASTDTVTLLSATLTHG